MGNGKSKGGTNENVTASKEQAPSADTPDKDADFCGNIAAIDFGTTSVSLAYTTKGDDEIRTISLESEEISLRVLNVILLKKDKDKLKVEGFGMNARKKFGVLKQSNNTEYIYFERIKMLMRREQVKS